MAIMEWISGRPIATDNDLKEWASGRPFVYLYPTGEIHSLAGAIDAVFSVTGMSEVTRRLTGLSEAVSSIVSVAVRRLRRFVGMVWD